MLMVVCFPYHQYKREKLLSLQERVSKYTYHPLNPFNFIEVTGVMRKRGDNIFINVLKNVRIGEVFNTYRVYELTKRK